MFGTGIRFLLVPLAASLLLTSCASFYRLDVGGDQVAQVRSVFLIVADKDPLGGGNVEPASLIRPEKFGEYLLFAQYDPVGGGPLRWQEQTLDSRSDLLAVSLSQDLGTITLQVNKTLLEGYKQLTLVAVGHGTDGWFAESVDTGKLRLEEGVRFDIRAARFVRGPLR